MKHVSTVTTQSRAFTKGVATVLDIGGTSFRGYRIPKKRPSRNQIFAVRWQKLGERLNVIIERESESATTAPHHITP